MTEAELWGITLEEFIALEGRRVEAEAFAEYCGALAPWAVFNVNRKQGKPFMPVEFFMQRHKARAGKMGPGGAPAQGVRFAKPGERPPSKYAGGVKDPVIARFDAYMKAVTGKEVPQWARLPES